MSGAALRHSPAVVLRARGGGEYDVSDADIEKFYEETLTGSGGDPPKGTVGGPNVPLAPCANCVWSQP